MYVYKQIFVILKNYSGCKIGNVTTALPIKPCDAQRANTPWSTEIIHLPKANADKHEISSPNSYDSMVGFPRS